MRDLRRGGEGLERSTDDRVVAEPYRTHGPALLGFALHLVDAWVVDQALGRLSPEQRATTTPPTS